MRARSASRHRQREPYYRHLLRWHVQHIIEDVQVDIAKLNEPTLHGSQYQDPTRLDENLRIACLMRDRYTCQHCGKRNCRLEAHHVVFRERGGKDTLANLLCLCEDCDTPAGLKTNGF